MTLSNRRNRLADTTSPYLQQHATNPVDWWPWCEGALSLAHQEDRPILLSVGYSACHWCHVMAHESFEDAATAELMNRLFVNIKVDREERPDLDKIYQSAHQLLAQRAGGWPLTVFLTPDDHTPYFAGTYFPKEARHGLPSFRDVLIAIERAYREQKEVIAEQNDSLRSALRSLNPSGDAERVVLDGVPLELARRQLASSFDAERGGFGKAPKFPHPTDLELLLRHYATTTIGGRPDAKALHMAGFTLERMARGGINDQIGGGFCRYSVDDLWMIPHFEKMLYDNGQLLGLCCEAWQATGREVFRATALATAEWVMREMQSPEGGYYSALDADSEGEEGRFYVWTREQVREAVGAEDYELFAACYGLDSSPNFEGKWHLHRFMEPAALAQRFGLEVNEAEERLALARRRLLEQREPRVRPGLDDKVLTAWNGLMIKGMARAARVFDRPDCLQSAERALDFIRDTLWRDGRLLATYKDGQAHLNAYLDDYANLIDALLELLQTRWRRTDLDFAIYLADALLDRFQDTDSGGFFFTSDDHEQLIHRPKPLGDESIPAGNGVAARVLIRLGHLLGETRYLEAAERTLRLAWAHIRQIPYAHATLLMALDEHLVPTETVIVRADENALRAWQARLHQALAPRRLALAIPADEAALPGSLAELKPQGAGIAYVCSGTRCGTPSRDLAEFDRALSSTEVRTGKGDARNRS